MNLFRNALAGLFFPSSRRKRVANSPKAQADTNSTETSQLNWNESAEDTDTANIALKFQPSAESLPLSIRMGQIRYASETAEKRAKNLRKELFRDSPPAESLSPSSNETDSEWLQAMSDEAERKRTKGKKAAPQDQESLESELSHNIFELFCNYSRQFNTLVSVTGLKIGFTNPERVAEKTVVRRKNGLTFYETTETVNYNRWRITTRSWSVSCRSANSVLEIFLVPVSDVMMLSKGETENRQRLRLELRKRKDEYTWLLDGLPAGADDIRVFSRQIFKELIRNTQEPEHHLQAEKSGLQQQEAFQPGSITKLLEERQNLAHKVVIQQENIQKRIARDLHDAVISDVMALKRDISTGEALDSEHLGSALDGIVERLREICYDLSPRDLADWGLQVVLQDLLESISERTAADCILNCDCELPALPAGVELHVYRIVQESLTNVAKYSQASRIAVTIEYNGSTLSVLVADDGKGFDPENRPMRDAKSGGYGFTSIKERVELIRCFYPTRFNIESTVNKGTRTLLEIDLR